MYTNVPPQLPVNHSTASPVEPPFAVSVTFPEKFEQISLPVLIAMEVGAVGGVHPQLFTVIVLVCVHTELQVASVTRNPTVYVPPLA